MPFTLTEEDLIKQEDAFNKVIFLKYVRENRVKWTGLFFLTAMRVDFRE